MGGILPFPQQFLMWYIKQKEFSQVTLDPQTHRYGHVFQTCTQGSSWVLSYGDSKDHKADLQLVETTIVPSNYNSVEPAEFLPSQTI